MYIYKRRKERKGRGESNDKMQDAEARTSGASFARARRMYSRFFHYLQRAVLAQTLEKEAGAHGVEQRSLTIRRKFRSILEFSLALSFCIKKKEGTMEKRKKHVSLSLSLPFFPSRMLSLPFLSLSLSRFLSLSLSFSYWSGNKIVPRRGDSERGSTLERRESSCRARGPLCCVFISSGLIACILFIYFSLNFLFISYAPIWCTSIRYSGP